MALLPLIRAHAAPLLQRLAGAGALVALAAIFVQAPESAVATEQAAQDPGIVAPAPATAVKPQRVTYTLLGPGTQASLLDSKGADVDGDGQPDFANPTGNAPRGKDAYGSGAFGASRTGHIHAGVDYVAEAGQRVLAPISGAITKVGQPYADDGSFRYVEITNRVTGYKARVMYVGPQVREGEAVQLGQQIGRAQTLQRRYPNGITDHVHLEIARTNGRTLNAAALVPVSNARG